MTQEEKRIRIAKACGWTRTELSTGGGWWTHPEYGNGDLPDYFNDLNACHEAEGTLSEFQHNHFAHWLHHDLGHKSVSAPPAIRAEHLGLTLGLWKEGE